MPLAALDVAIGLILLYLLLSLVVLAINEGIATLVNFRAQTLMGGLQTLIGGTSAEAEARRWIDRLYGHPVIAALHERRQIWGTGHKRPAYIPPQAFIAALVDEITRSANAARVAVGQPKLMNVSGDVAQLRDAIEQSALPYTTREQFRVLLDNAQGDLARARQTIERWFEDGMERVSAVYKARIHSIGVLVALVVTLGVNADTIAIARALAGSATLRASVVSQAEMVAKAPTLDSLLRMRVDSLTLATFPVGYPPRAARRPAVAFYAEQAAAHWPGWLLTAIAVSLGAPFWFDILNKVMNVRGAGRAPEEKPKSPKDAPPARGDT